MEVDAFYRLQGFLFGQSNSFEVIFAKVFTDQFIYCVIWAAPTTAIFYGWKNANFVWAGGERNPRLQVPAWRVSFFTFFHLDYLDSSCGHSLCHALKPTDSVFQPYLMFFCAGNKFLEPAKKVA